MHCSNKKISVVKFAFLCLLAAGMVSCSKNDSDDVATEPVTTEPPLTAETATPSGEVMMQAFYWDVTPGGVWWDTLNAKLDAWKSAGITGLWLPVISKGQSGQYSMGYDPFDYFDFGQYNQHGTVETRFGAYDELKSLLTNAKAKGFTLIADIVLNHNSGGDLETNPITNANGYTKFTPASGKFNRTYLDFHPNGTHAADDGTFAGFPDLCHDVANVQDWLWKRSDGMAKFYRDSLGFDGWRFDYVKGFSPTVVKSWMDAVGGTGIVEYWDGDVSLVNNYATAAGTAAFDFPLMYALRDAFNGGDLSKLKGAGLVAVNPTKAYTFVANHDVSEIYDHNKLKAYTYILTTEGKPFIFYKDYESALDKEKLNGLIWIKKNLAAGSTSVLLSGSKQYIYRRNGTPGLVAFFNNDVLDASQKIQTAWAGKTLKDYTGNNADATTDASGYVTLTCKGNSYAVYAPK